MPDLDAVLLRVEKLLALATSNNVHEAALAASRAQALIAAHRLEGLIAARAEHDVEIGEEALERARRPRRWRGSLAQGLAEQNACITYSVQIGLETELRVVGRPEDRRLVRALFEGLAPRLEWLSATHGSGRNRAWHEAFRIGAAEAVVARLLTESEAGEPQRLALQVDHDRRRAAVSAWAERHLRLGSGRSLLLDSRGYTKGSNAAAGLELPTRR